MRIIFFAVMTEHPKDGGSTARDAVRDAGDAAKDVTRGVGYAQDLAY